MISGFVKNNAFIRGTAALAVLFCFALSASGCGSKGHEFTDEGYTRIDAHKYEEALVSFAAAREAGEDERLITRGEGIIYLTLGEYEQAEECLTASMDAGIGLPERLDFDTSYYLAECFTRQERYEAAAEVYDAILALHPKDMDACYLRGVAELAAGRSDDAWADFNRVMAVDPSDHDRLLNIYEALYNAGMESEGMALLQRAISDTGASMTNYDKGRISYYLGNNAEAQSYLEQARSERDTDKLPVVIMLGRTAQKQGDYNYAVSVYKTFLGEDADHPEIWNQLGLCLIRMGDYDSAIAAFESGRALPDGESDRALMRNEVTAYEYSGQFQQARVLMEKYMKAFPDDKGASREYIFLSTR